MCLQLRALGYYDLAARSCSPMEGLPHEEEKDICGPVDRVGERRWTMCEGFFVSGFPQRCR